MWNMRRGKELYCKICAPHLTGNGYCAKHSSTGKAYFDDEIKQFVDQMIPAFNEGYKQWHEKEWKEFISQIKDQFKQEVIDELEKMPHQMTEQEIADWKSCHSEIKPDQGWLRYEEGIFVGKLRAIEIIKSK